jgi:hypothetical protein
MNCESVPCAALTAVVVYFIATIIGLCTDTLPQVEETVELVAPYAQFFFKDLSNRENFMFFVLQATTIIGIKIARLWRQNRLCSQLIIPVKWLALIGVLLAGWYLPLSALK